MSTSDYARLTSTEDVEEEDDARVHQQAERAAVADMRAAVAEMRATIAPHGAGELLALQGDDGFARPSPSAKPEGKYTASDDGDQQPARVAQGPGPPTDPSLDEPAANVDRGTRQGQHQQQQQQEERGGPGRLPFRPGGTPSPGVSTSLRNASSVLSTTKNQKKRSSKEFRVAQLATQTVEGRRAREKAKMAALESAELRRRQALQAALRATPPRCAPTAAAQQQRFVEGRTQQQQQQQQQQQEEEEEEATFDEDGSATVQMVRHGMQQYGGAVRYGSTGATPPPKQLTRRSPTAAAGMTSQAAASFQADMLTVGEGDDAASPLAAPPATRACCSCRRSCSASADDAGAADGGTKKDDGKKRKRCYIRLQVLVVAISEVEHSFKVRGGLDLFWEEEKGFAARVKRTSPDIDVPLGSVSDGVYQKPATLPDDGVSSLPLNPETPFDNQLEFREIAQPKLLFDQKRGIVHYSIAFEATLSAWFDMHNFPFDRQVLPITLKFRSSAFRQSPEPFEGVPEKWNLRTPVSAALNPVAADQHRLRSDGACIIYDCSNWKPTVKILCERIATPWIYNFVLPTFMLVVTAGSIALVPPEDIGNRLATLLALMLTLVALKFSVAEKLPVVPYTTKLDIQLLLGFVLICATVLAACASCLVSLRSPHARDDSTPWTAIDLWVLRLGGGLWVALHGYTLLLDTRDRWDHVLRRKAARQPNEMVIVNGRSKS